eukprot:3761000-Pleurochrysis_carterae.AAC.2
MRPVRERREADTWCTALATSPPPPPSPRLAPALSAASTAASGRAAGTEAAGAATSPALGFLVSLTGRLSSKMRSLNANSKDVGS